MFLPFESLITFIINYQQGIPLKETYNQISHHLRSVSGLKTWLYMYRAGAFNDEIIRLAPKYGYNADVLISKECESNVETKQKILI